jgi:acyl-CoA synthetase (AMP-forming)/AMP-acid ligase II
MYSIDMKLRQWAAVYPDKPCIIEAETGVTLTYRQCLTATQSMRKLLGDTPRNLFLTLSGGIADAILWLAALTGGHTLVPLAPDASYGEHRRAVSMFHPDVLIIDGDGDVPDLASHATQVMTRQQCEALLFQSYNEEIQPMATVEGHVCLMTSGTTGEPKGVILNANQIVWTADHIRSSHNLTPADRGLTVLPFFHVNAPVVSLCASIMAGSTVVIASHFSRTNFWNWIEKYKITWASIVPTIVAILLKTEKPAFLPGALRFVRTASAPLPAAHLNAFEAKFGIPVIETYGLSEAASQVTANPVPPGKHIAGSVGLPIGLALRVCQPRGEDENDKVLHDVAPGETGEICVRGPSLIHAYWGDRGNGAFQNGWFRTGDLGHQDRNGYVYITGRLRDVIIRGGENIAPREIEETLLSHPAIDDVVVVGRPDNIYGEQAVAFVVLCEDWNPHDAIASLREYSTRHFSPHKVPSDFIVLHTMPRNHTGKVDRPLLREGSLEQLPVGGN